MFRILKPISNDSIVKDLLFTNLNVTMKYIKQPHLLIFTAVPIQNSVWY